jgi:hypothetical protein
VLISAFADAALSWHYQDKMINAMGGETALGVGFEHGTAVVKMLTSKRRS